MKNKNINDDLKGFKDFIDQPKNKVKPKISNSDLITFLEYETIRIEKLTELFYKKGVLLKKYPHQNKIKEELLNYNQELKSKIIKKLAHNDSTLVKSLAELFNPHFRN